MAEPSSDPTPTDASRAGTRELASPRVPRPWWRRRRFWQAVIAVEVVAALAVSVAFGEDPDGDPVPVPLTTTVPPR